MSWERALLDLFEDLEQQAAGLSLAERESEVAELSVAHYADIDLAARLHASVGGQVQLRLLGGQLITGELTQVGADWALLRGLPEEWIVPLGSITATLGLSSRADTMASRGALARLTLTSVLRGLASARADCVVFWSDQHQLAGRLGRVGSDFVEISAGAQGQEQILTIGRINSIRSTS
ncbi:MAG TPA: hypothetical protein PLC19_02090 [Marmoricola sp.]|nr:hypothetical protein [Marmoricola sp.]